MKKILAIVLAITMLLPIMTVNPFAAALSESTTLALYCGQFDNGGFSPLADVEITHTGSYNIKYDFSEPRDYNWIILKNKAGEDVSTNIPEGYIIKANYVKVNGAEIAISDSLRNYEVKNVGDTMSKVEIQYVFDLNNVQGTASSVEIDFEVIDPNASSGEIEVPISTDNLGTSKDCTISNGVAISNDGGSEFSFKLPKTYSANETVKVKIVYTAEDEFRVRLSTDDPNADGNNTWKPVDPVSNKTEITLELTPLIDNISQIYFKAKSWDAKLSGVSIYSITLLDTASSSTETVLYEFTDFKNPYTGYNGLFDTANAMAFVNALKAENSTLIIEYTFSEKPAWFNFTLQGNDDCYVEGGTNSWDGANTERNGYQGVNLPLSTEAGFNTFTMSGAEVISIFESMSGTTCNGIWDTNGTKNIGGTFSEFKIENLNTIIVQPGSGSITIHTFKVVGSANESHIKGEVSIPSTGYMSTADIWTYPPDNYNKRKAGVTYNDPVKIWYYSSYCERERPANVVLPVNYDPNKKYPVMYIYHGMSCNEDTMVNDDHATHILLQNMMAEGLCEEMILVFPYIYANKDPNMKPETETAKTIESFKPYDEFQIELVQDLMPYIESHYSVATGKDNTAVFGFSMGGREALATGIMYPDKFGYVAAACPAPGLIPNPEGDWAFKPEYGGHPGQFQKNELVYGNDVHYVTMIGKGGNDGTVGNHPTTYHETFTENGVEHIWYIIPDSDHGEPAVGSVAYNFAKMAFRATKTEGPSQLFYSPYTGSDTTGNGTKSNPYKTEAKVKQLLEGYSNADEIEILEYMLTFDIYCGSGQGISPDGSTAIPFDGKVNSHYFTGETTGVGHDAQGVVGSPWFCANYSFKGTDYTGEECSLFVENLGGDLADCTPIVYTDSSALSDINNSDLKAIVDVGNLIYINVYKKHTADDILYPSAPAPADGDSLIYSTDAAGTLTISGVGDMADYTYESHLGDSSVTKVVIEDGVTSIGAYAFYDLPNLTSVTIPDSVTKIGDSAFRHCEKLTDVSFGKGVEVIGNNAFSYTALTEVSVPGNVTVIGDLAFASCPNVTKVTIPGSVGTIGKASFYDCPELSDVTICCGAGEQTIGEYAFAYCPKLAEIIIPVSVSSIGKFTFAYCTSLRSVTISQGVTEIGKWAFYHCTALTDISIPNTVTTIGDFAFKDCTALKKVTIQKGTTNFGAVIFHKCDNVTVYGYNGSVAQSYSNQRSYSFETVNETEKTDELSGYTLTLSGDIGVNYYFTLTDKTVKSTNAYVLFTMPDGTTEKVDISTLELQSNGMYVLSCDVASTQMTGTIKAQIFVDGVPGEIYAYSAQSYGKYIYENSGNIDAYNKAKPLVTAMLNFGGYAQEYFGEDYKTDNCTLANSILSDSDRSLASVDTVSDYDYSIHDTPTGIKYYGSSLILQSKTSVRHYFTLEEGYSIDKFKFTLEDGTVLTPVQKKDNYYYVTIENIAADELGNKYTLYINNQSALEYSAMAYAQKQINQSNDEKLVNVMKALYLYNRAAIDYK